ncbi:uncharacterized protein Fot_55700 [Forsythia ovata]|uniref:CCHC-type domain-containing protein n=1 Tax=Forsythia ovata TaxID=205694 RepID=A0ABD1P3J8_9LAMI
MDEVRVFLNYNGRWDENNRYVDNETKEILVSLGTSYVGLLEILFGALGLGPSSQTIRMKYIAEVGSSPIKILHDRDVLFYLKLKKKDHQIDSYPICLEILNEPMKEILPPSLEENNHVSDANILNPPHEFNPDPPVEANGVRLNAGTEDEINVANTLSNAQVFTEERFTERETESSNADDGHGTNEEFEYGVRDTVCEGEETNSVTCSRCKHYGHNRRTCPNSIPLSPDNSDDNWSTGPSATNSDS